MFKFSQYYLDKFVTSIDYTIAIKQKELFQKLLSTGMDENTAKQKVGEYFTLAKNNGAIVDWILAREQDGMNLTQISKFLDWYGRNKQNLPVEKRDIFKIDTNYIQELQTKQETDIQQEQQAKSAISEVYNDGTYSIIKADTPEAIVEVANCDGVGANSWCIKGLEFAKQYGPPAFFIKKNGKLYVAVVPHADEIRNLADTEPSAALAKEVFKPVKFIIDNFSDGIWPSSRTFQEFRLINNELFKQSLSPEDQQKYGELYENPRAYPINTLPEVLRLEVLKQVPQDIQWIKNPTEKEQIVALRFADNAKSVLRLILDKNIIPTEQVQLLAVRQSAYILALLKEKNIVPTEQVQLEAVKSNGTTIEYINNPSEQVQLEAVRQYGMAIQYIKNPSEQVQLEAVRQNGLAIDYIIEKGINPSEQVQLEAVRKNGWVIQYIKNPSEQVQLEAVKQNGWAIQYIKNRSEQVQLEAVKQNGLAIYYIKNPYPSVVDYVNNAKNKTAIKLTIKE